MSIEHGWVDDLLGQRDALRRHLRLAMEQLEDIEPPHPGWWLAWKTEAEELLDATAD